MATKKVPSTKNKKRKTAARAPGKSDPGFLDKLSRAIQEEYRSAGASGNRTPPEPTPPRPILREAPAKPAAEKNRLEKKTSPAKARSGASRRSRLLKELTALLEELDEEGLDFLLEQAHVHRYNMEVERLNDAEERRTSSRESKTRERTLKSGKAGPRTSALRIERSKDGNTYHVVSGGRYKMFSAEEMLALVRIAHANLEPTEAGRGLHRWMSRERTDALSDLGIAGPSDPNLAALAHLLKTSFAKPVRR